MEESCLSGGKLEDHHCFLCLVEIPSKSHSKKEVDNSNSSGLTQSTKLLIQYLLRCPAPHCLGDGWKNPIFQNVLQLDQDKRGGTTQFVKQKRRSWCQLRFCGNCVRRAEEVVELEKEMEGIRGKILDKVKALEEMIVSGVSKEKGGRRRSVIEKAEEVVQTLKGDELEDGRKFLEVLESLQSFVIGRNGRKTKETLGAVAVKVEPRDGTLEEDVSDHFDDFGESFNDAVDDANFEVRDEKIPDEVFKSKKRPSNRKSEKDLLPVKKRKRATAKADKRKSGEEEQSERQLRTRGTFSCKKCSRKFKTQKELDTHISDQHDDDSSGEGSDEDEQNLEEVASPLPQPEPAEVEDPGPVAEEDEASKPEESTKKKKPQNWWCSLCSQKFNRKSKLKEHRKEAHPEAGEEEEKVTCVVCSNQFWNKGALARHRKSCVLPGSGESLCSVCGKEFATPKLLTKHMWHHSALRYFCDQCNYVTTSAAILRRHSIKHVDPMERPPVEKTVPCPHCDMWFATPAILRKHMRVHTKETPFQCDICGMSFRYAHGLKRHKRVIHEERNSGKVYACEFCDFRTPNPDYLKTHLHTRHEPNPEMHQCHACGKRFVSKGNVRLHMRNCKMLDPADRPANDRHFCDICGKAFASKTILQHHQVTLHGVGDTYTETLYCDQCSYATRFPWYLTLHQGHHKRHPKSPRQRDGKWHCDTCGAKYHQKASLVQHKKKNVCARRVHRLGLNVEKDCLEDTKQFQEPLEGHGSV